MFIKSCPKSSHSSFDLPKSDIFQSSQISQQIFGLLLLQVGQYGHTARDQYLGTA